MSLDPKVKEMSLAWNSGNYHNMQEIAFVLQGASGTLGAEKLSDVCDRLSQSLKINEGKMINKFYGNFLVECRDLKFTISKITGMSICLGEIDELFIEFSNKTQPGRSGIIIDDQGTDKGECGCRVF